MAEFLRRIPETIEKHVLIIAMTNKLDMIDPAVLRRGRFDHKILVDYASEEEILLMLEESFKKISVCNDLDIISFAKKLSNRPMSDVAFFIKEGARIAAKNRKDKLDNASLNEALKMVLNDKKEVIEHYIDIIKESGLDPEYNIPYFIDLYLDITVLYNGDIRVIDENELQDAYNSSEITKAEYNQVIELKNKLINEIKTGTNKYMNLDITKYLEYF